MQGYEAAMRTPCLTKGDMASPREFSKVRFVVAHEDVARVWAGEITKHMSAGNWEIAVGGTVVYPSFNTNDGGGRD